MEQQFRVVKEYYEFCFLQKYRWLKNASLRTFFYEAMSIINRHPLTPDGIADPKGQEPLTPNHLRTMKSSISVPPPGKFVVEDLYTKKRWHRLQYITSNFGVDGGPNICQAPFFPNALPWSCSLSSLGGSGFCYWEYTLNGSLGNIVNSPGFCFLCVSLQEGCQG